MGKFLTAILILLSSLSYGQYSNIGNYTNPNDTARGRNLLIQGGVRLPAYAPSSGDSTLLIALAAGRVVPYSLDQFLARISSFIGSPTFQDILNNGSDLTQENDINLNGFRFRIFGGRLETDSNQIGALEIINSAHFNAHLWDEYTEYSVPDVGYVENLITQTSWDSTMSETVTELTSTRFTKPVSTVNYAGMSFNSDYFSQNLLTGTITFIGLTFYNGQKLTFNR